MTCEQIRALLATRRQLSFAQEQAAQTHLATCSRCTTLWQQEERIMQQLRSLPIPPGALPEHTARAIRHTLLTHCPVRRQQRRGAIFVGAVLALLVLASVFQIQLRRFITQTVGVRSAVPTPAAVFPATATSQAGTLYIASTVTDANAQNVVGARVTAVDLATWQERYRVEGGDEATLSPNGTRLYVAGALPGSAIGDAVRAVDAQTGHEIWRTLIMHRAGYPGQGNLVVSPDGRWLYIRSYDTTQAHGDASTVPFWLQIVDTATGNKLSATIALPNSTVCGAPKLISPPVGHISYISCNNYQILAINTQTQRIEPLISDAVTGAILSPNAREMYTVNTALEVSVLDSLQRTLISKATMRPSTPFAPSYGLATVSGDGVRLVAGQTIQGRPGTDTGCEIRIFELHTGAEVGGFRYDRPLYAFALNATGTRLYAGVGDMTNNVIVELDLLTGTMRAEHRRPQENITQLFVGR